MEPARLSATDLACRRGERLLFRGLTFTLHAGEALQVVGPNGTGKSSLIRILAGLLRPYAGTVERTVEAALLDERLALDGHLPLGKALAFWQRIDGLDCGLETPVPDGEGLGVGPPAPPAAPNTPTLPSPSRGRGTAADTLELEPLLDVPVRYLSTGQRKRAAILMSNAREAGLWLLDEPLNGLDSEAAAAFQQQVAGYLAQGGIAVIASHQPFAVPGMQRLALADYAP